MSRVRRRPGSSPNAGSSHEEADDSKSRKRQQQVPGLFQRAAATCMLAAVAAALVVLFRPHLQEYWQQQQQTLSAFLGYTTTRLNGNSSSWDVSQVHSVTAADGTVFGPSLGIFPHGCKWRDVTAAAGNTNSEVTYQYWDTSTSTWASEQPAACRLQGFGSPGPPKPWNFHKGNPRTEVVPHTHHVLYHNLWYNNGRWYALVDSDKTVPSWKFSKNHEITTLHVKDARKWLNTTRWRVVPGDTLLFDFIFFTHATAIGHWWELLGPLFSVLKSGAQGFKRPCDQMVLLHLKRTHLMEWVRAVMSVALGVRAHQDLPPVLLQQETDHPWQQLTMPLEDVKEYEWVMFDHVLIVRDLFTGGNRSFTNTADAREFRAAVYQQYGMPAPAKRRRVPHILTFQRKRANRRIVNEAELLQVMSRYGEVRVVEFNSSTPFADQLRVMRETGVFVSAHTSNLANAVFLQPGAAVIEIIQRHWTWNNMDQSFRDHTTQLGDLHHFAWRANHPNETIYHSIRDAARFTNWTKGDCLIEDCTEAATRVDIVVDLHAFACLLDSRLPLVFQGRPVGEAALPWPEAL